MRIMNGFLNTIGALAYEKPVSGMLRGMYLPEKGNKGLS